MKVCNIIQIRKSIEESANVLKDIMQIQNAGVNTSELMEKSASDAITACRKSEIFSIPKQITADTLTPQFLKSLSKKLSLDAKRDFQFIFDDLKEIFDGTHCNLSGRLKQSESILPRLTRSSKKLIGSGKNFLQKAENEIYDLRGYKLTLHKGYGADEVVQKIISMVKSGKYKPVKDISNFGNRPYIEGKMNSELEKAGFQFAPPKNRNKFITCSNLYLKNENGKIIELQIIGRPTDIIAQREHKAYNYFTKGQALEKGIVDKKVQQTFDSMTPEQIEIYQYYKDKCYDYARAVELYEFPEKPYFPEELDEALRLIK